MQANSIPKGANVIVIDDLIATGTEFCMGTINLRASNVINLAGGSAKAAGELIQNLGGNTLEYLFVIGLTFLKGTEKLDAPSYCMIESDE